ncbi:hypothetical protein [Alteraurantiacibacter palmitatis]|uniref:DUF3795 domain-containing protein n=1 Tax=Alteraurantiacibacter palmitatis TaxID=2054628 RepID=A0ABV7E5W1_9SPHN
MGCERVTMPGGGYAIVCGTHRNRERCSCGRPATLLCDWRLTGPDGRRSGTCDTPICASCTTSPEPGKDLCRPHAREFEIWRSRRAKSRRVEQ